jgi:hypothetical protein
MRRMGRWAMRILVGLSGLIVLAALAGTTYQWMATREDLASTPPPGRLVDIGGDRLHVWCTGDGAPAVILDTGLGPDASAVLKKPLLSWKRARQRVRDPLPGKLPLIAQESQDAVAVGLGEVDGVVVGGRR